MNTVSIILLVTIGVVFTVALILTICDKISGKCCNGCGGNCASCKRRNQVKNK